MKGWIGFVVVICGQMESIWLLIEESFLLYDVKYDTRVFLEIYTTYLMVIALINSTSVITNFEALLLTVSWIGLEFVFIRMILLRLVIK